MHRINHNPRILKMRFPQKEVQRDFTTPVRRRRQQRRLVHIPQRRRRRRDADELRLLARF